MSDFAHEWTDKQIEELEERIRQIYEQASKEMEQKFHSFYDEFVILNAQKKEMVQNGTLSNEEYSVWRRARRAEVNRLKRMSDDLAYEMTQANYMAINLSRSHIYDVYAMNYDFSQYVFYQDSGGAYSFTIYNREAVENLLRDDISLLPYAKTNSPKAQLLRERADLIWNRQKINNAITQGILQGESPYKIATRLQKVTDMNRAAAVLNARTMLGAAQNKGRDDVYEDLKKQGADVKCIWIANLDGRTRHSHALLHGTEKGEDGFYMNDLEYPCDPNGDPEEVYNCRCTEITVPADVDFRVTQQSQALNGQGFEEWIESYGDPSTVKWWNEQVHQTREQQVERNIFAEKKVDDPVYKGLKGAMEKAHVLHNPAEKLSHVLNEDEIISKVGGGDRTEGSCASAALAYAGNKAGYDVRDFRGGASRMMFASAYNLNRIAEMSGVDGTVIRDTTTERKDGWRLLNGIEEGKEYLFGIGKHMAVVKKDEEYGFLYLELQTTGSNGWHVLNDYALTHRFACPQRKTRYANDIELFDVEKIGQNADFQELLGYLNTEESKQNKGLGGNAK